MHWTSRWTSKMNTKIDKIWKIGPCFFPCGFLFSLYKKIVFFAGRGPPPTSSPAHTGTSPQDVPMDV